ARRRAMLTAILLVLSVAVGALAALSVLSAWLVLVPAALLGTVLVLGRRAVVGNQRADAAWEERELERRAARAAAADRQLHGRPPAVGRPTVTGRAVHGSQSHTQIIARVRSAQDAVGDDHGGPDHVASASQSPVATS